jgi:4-carboxymuconolactone decarboxylase
MNLSKEFLPTASSPIGRSFEFCCEHCHDIAQAEDTNMNDRENLRHSGAEIRQRLGLDQADPVALAPGLRNLTDEMVFGRVWARPGLALEDRMLATLSALTAMQYLPQLAEFVGAALHIGLRPRLLQEVMLHCAMYAGMPSAINSLEVVGAVLDEQSLPRPEVDLTHQELSLEALMERGEQVKQMLHAERAAAGYANAESAASGLYGSVATQYLYGEIWERPGMTVRERMICSVAAFTALRMESQQRKFFRSALNVGLTSSEVVEVITQTGPYSGFPSALNAVTVAEEVLAL